MVRTVFGLVRLVLALPVLGRGDRRRLQPRRVSGQPGDFDRREILRRALSRLPERGEEIGAAEDGDVMGLEAK